MEDFDLMMKIIVVGDGRVRIYVDETMNRLVKRQ